MHRVCRLLPPNAGVLAAPKAEVLLAPPPKLKGELAAGVDAAAPKRPPPAAGALAPKPPNAGVLAGVAEPKPPPKGEGLVEAPKAGAVRIKQKQQNSGSAHTCKILASTYNNTNPQACNCSTSRLRIAAS